MGHMSSRLLRTPAHGQHNSSDIWGVQAPIPPAGLHWQQTKQAISHRAALPTTAAAGAMGEVATGQESTNYVLIPRRLEAAHKPPADTQHLEGGSY